MNKPKYGNHKVTTADGETFDSQKEYHRYMELSTLQRAGKIAGLRRQVKYVLIPSHRRSDGKLERECSYIADFVYFENARTVVEDVKGYRNPQSAGYAKFVIKRKLMLYVHGIEVREV